MENILNFFISPALADLSAPMSQGPAGGGISFAMMFVVFFVFIYFAVWRPQNKRAKEQQNLINSLAKGEEVIIGGGILGRIVKVSDQYVVLSIANNVDIIVQKTSVLSVLPKGTLKTIE